MRLIKALLAVAALAAVFVPSALAFRFTDSTRLIPTLVTGQSFSHKIETAGGCHAVTVSVQNGSLPPGVRLVGSPDAETTSNYRFEGTPTAPGEYSFWLRAVTSIPECCPGGNCDSTEEPFTIRVVAGLAIQANAFPGRFTVGEAYSAKLDASGGGNQSWSASGLPAGLTMAPDGTISGTPTAAGSYAATLTVRDGSRSATKTFTASVREPLRLARPAFVPAAEVGYAYVLRGFGASGGSGGYSWSAEGSAFAFDAASGTLSGTPLAAGTVAATLRVTDSEGRFATLSVPIRVAPRLAIATRRLPALKSGRTYALSIRTTGGVAKVSKGREFMSWRVAGGRFPVGVRLDKFRGMLVGTPRRAGVYRFTLEVTDRYGAVARQAFFLTVRK